MGPIQRQKFWKDRRLCLFWAAYVCLAYSRRAYLAKGFGGHKTKT